MEQKFTSTTSGPLQIREEDVVGLEEEVKLLLNISTFQRRRYFSYLCILGMDGVGKTTLASLLYNHADVASQFEIRAWVKVSAASTAKDILMELIRQMLKEGEMEMMKMIIMAGDEEGLWRIILLRLMGRSYFILLDDVWTRDQLLPILRRLPRRGENNMLVTTSRKNDGVMLGRGYVHEMKTLDHSKSWELFVKKVFTNYQRCPKHLERIGRQIVRKCDGLPLAIQEVGAKLANITKPESAWEEFSKTMELSETIASLESSYHILSKRMKSCFSSLGFFKEGTTIRVDRLIQIWNAGGIVSQMDDDDNDDEDDDYDEDENENEDDDEDECGRWDVDVLIEQYFVKVKDMNKDLTVKNCEINYNLHRLAIKKAKEDLMFEVITKDVSNHQSTYKPRHRAICCSREMFNYSANQDKILVSLFFRGGGNFNASPLYWKSFESLKILDLEDFGLKRVPEVIRTLITLKYLGLRNNFIKELPCSLVQLENLEVLDIALNFMVEVADIIWKMESLRHLYMSAIICWEPLKIDKLYNLETLTYISIDMWTYEVSGSKMMNNLRKLGIEEVDENSDVGKLFALLAELDKLEHLILKGFRFKSMPELHELHILRGLKQLKLDGFLTSLPSADNFPPNLEYLILSNSCLAEDPMPTLEQLPELYYLKLRNAFIGEQMVISSNGFASLQILCIEELWHLKAVQVEEDSRVELTHIEIKSCPYMKILPQKFRSKMVTTKDEAPKTEESSGLSSSTNAVGSTDSASPVFDFSSLSSGIKFVGSLSDLGNNSVNSNSAPSNPGGSIFSSSPATGFPFGEVATFSAPINSTPFVYTPSTSVFPFTSDSEHASVISSGSAANQSRTQTEESGSKMVTAKDIGLSSSPAISSLLSCSTGDAAPDFSFGSKSDGSGVFKFGGGASASSDAPPSFSASGFGFGLGSSALSNLFSLVVNRSHLVVPEAASQLAVMVVIRM